MKRMAFSLTIEAIEKQTKTVTRRPAETWRTLKVGDRIVAVDKCMGLKKGPTAAMARRTNATYCSGVLGQQPHLSITEKAPESSRTGTVAGRGSPRSRPLTRVRFGQRSRSQRSAESRMGPRALPSQIQYGSGETTQTHGSGLAGDTCSAGSLYQSRASAIASCSSKPGTTMRWATTYRRRRRWQIQCRRPGEGDVTCSRGSASVGGRQPSG